MPARPYMARFRILSRLIWPSARPLLHGSAIACLTRLDIASHGSRELLHRPQSGTPGVMKEATQLSRITALRRPRKRIASRRIATKLGEASFRSLSGVSVGVASCRSARSAMRSTDR